MRSFLLIIIGALLAGCVGAKVWTVPTDLHEGSAAEMVKTAAEAGKLRDLMIAAEEALFDTDEMRFAEFLRAALETGKLSESEVSTAEWMLYNVCELNAPGSKAADFSFKTSTDHLEVTLSEYLPGRSVAMIIYDPDCGSCKDEIAKLADLGKLVDVLAVCVEATEERWAQTRDALPQDWVKAFDCSGIFYNDYYVIRSMPGIYLIDSERKVILKHPKAEQLLEYLKK